METETLISQLARIGKTSEGRPAPYALARLAGVSDPESLSSPGSTFLIDTFDSWLELVSYELRNADPQLPVVSVVRTLDHDSINRDTSISNGYSEFTCWRVFTDLALSQDDALDEWAGAVARLVCDEISASVISKTLAISMVDAARMTVEAVSWRLSDALCQSLETIARKGGR